MKWMALAVLVLTVACGGSEKKADTEEVLPPTTGNDASRSGTPVTPVTTPTTSTTTSDGQTTQVSIQPGTGAATPKPEEIKPASNECLEFCRATCAKVIECQLATFSTAEECTPDCKATIEHSRIDDMARCNLLKEQHTANIAECGQLWTMITCHRTISQQKIELGIMITYLTTLLSGTNEFCEYGIID